MMRLPCGLKRADAMCNITCNVFPRLNWQLHFGEAPKWAQGVKFILVDIDPSPRDAGLAAVTLRVRLCILAHQAAHLERYGTLPA